MLLQIFSLMHSTLPNILNFAFPRLYWHFLIFSLHFPKQSIRFIILQFILLIIYFFSSRFNIEHPFIIYLNFSN